MTNLGLFAAKLRQKIQFIKKKSPKESLFEDSFHQHAVFSLLPRKIVLEKMECAKKVVHSFIFFLPLHHEYKIYKTHIEGNRHQ